MKTQDRLFPDAVFLCYYIYWFQFMAERIAENCQVSYSIAKQRATVAIELLFIISVQTV